MESTEMEAGIGPERFPMGCLFRMSPFSGLSFVAPTVPAIPLLASCGLPFMAASQLGQGLTVLAGHL